LRENRWGIVLLGMRYENSKKKEEEGKGERRMRRK